MNDKDLAKLLLLDELHLLNSTEEELRIMEIENGGEFDKTASSVRENLSNVIKKYKESTK